MDRIRLELSATFVTREPVDPTVCAELVAEVKSCAESFFKSKRIKLRTSTGVVDVFSEKHHERGNEDKPNV